MIPVLQPRILLHIEGATALAAALFLYARNDGNWLLFVLLVLAPDLSMLGYLAGTGVGATTYNLVHAYTLPALLAAFGVLAPSTLALSLALIWIAHIGADRLVGYGLKYPTAFKDTHLQKV